MEHPYTYPENRHAWYVRYTYGLLKGFFGPIFRLIWIKSVIGMENIPPIGPVIVAFNHQSFFDFLGFTAVCPRDVHFLSAEKFFASGFWRPLMKMTGQIKVHRSEHDKHKLHATVHDHLKNGKVIGIFPEGTRAPDPVEMLHAFTGVARYAIDAGVPVIPVGIRGAHQLFPRHAKMPKFHKSMSFHVGAPIHFHEYAGSGLSESDYRSATDKVMAEIARLSGKNYSFYGKLERDSKPAV